MKKFFIPLCLCLVVNSKAQVIFEHTYDSASTFLCGAPAVSGQLMLIKFEVSGEHYVNYNRWGKYISIYDLNHSLTKTISLSGLPLNGGVIGDVLYISEQLFDLDSGIEYMYAYIGSTNYTGIYNEDGTLIFSDTGVAQVHINFPQQQLPIYNTSQGTKMILSYKNIQNPTPTTMIAKVFGLAGTLTTAIQAANQNLIQAQGILSNPAPNPVLNTTRIDYALPKESNRGEMVFYDLQGIEIKRFKVDNTFNHLLLSTADIPAGTYYYLLETAGRASAGKKMVVIK